MSHVYNEKFFEYIELGSVKSSNTIIPVMLDAFALQSVLDVGCGRGAWCSSWLKHGIIDLIGVDGEYVDVNSLRMPKENFIAKNLSRAFDLDRKFDLVVCLEVAEHIPDEFSDTFIENLVKHSDVILFSAATPGQGGEFHVNERPFEFWRAKFARHGYDCFDYLRPKVIDSLDVEPWYKYNALLYINKKVLTNTSSEIPESLVKPEESITDVSPMSWKIRCGVLNMLPKSMVNILSLVFHKYHLFRLSLENKR